MRPPLAHWLALVLAWREHDTEDAVALLWQRIVYATRYGRASLAEALLLDQSHLEQFIRAVVKLVEDENDANRPSSFQNRT